ncbi:MAG: UvrB/UvrC motif-containing protein [Puniceicoccales bacterium]
MSNKTTCQVCNSPATVFIGFISGGKMSKACYCHDHATELGILDENSFGLLDEGDASKDPLFEKDTVVCPECGYSRRLFKQTGRVGCPTCYETFHDEVAALLPRMHRGTEHLGRIPKGYVDSKQVKNRIRALEKEMKRAIKDERYEDAAEVRDEMSGLRAKLEIQD